MTQENKCTNTTNYGYTDLIADIKKLTDRTRELRAAAERYDLKLNEWAYMKICIEYKKIAEESATVYHKYDHVRQHQCLTDAQRETATDRFAQMMFSIVETSQKL